MAFCGKCGQQVNDEVKFCPACGAPMAAVAPTQETPPQPAAAPQQQYQQPQPVQQPPQAQQPQPAAGDTFSNLNNTADSTAQFDPRDIEQHKGMSILAYFGPLVLIPILAAKDSPFARYHSNQGLLLCIACIIYGIAYSILSGVILAISWRLYFVVSIIGLIGFVFAVLAVIGILNAVNGRAKELPLIGKYRLLK
ncbi:zinc-ribbon domain-containing protein [Parabacteroides goldsteinii]